MGVLLALILAGAGGAVGAAVTNHPGGNVALGAGVGAALGGAVGAAVGP